MLIVVLVLMRILFSQTGHHLSMFPTVDGSKATAGLFKAYEQPDGSKAYFYSSGGSYEKAGSMHHRPDVLPVSLQLLWQSDLPVPPPPSSRTTVEIFPAPPLPADGTIAPESVTDLVIDDVACIWVDFYGVPFPAKPLTPEKRPHREWNLADHSRVWQPRKKENPAKDYFDGPHSNGKITKKALAEDCGRIADKPSIVKLLLKYNTKAKTPKSPKAKGKTDSESEGGAGHAKAQLVDALKECYLAVVAAFIYYAATGGGGGNDVFGMSFNEYGTLVNDTKVKDEEYRSCSSSSLDTLFITCNLSPMEDKELAKANSKHTMMRFEFVEFYVRIAIARYIERPLEHEGSMFAPCEIEVAETVAEAIRMLSVNEFSATNIPLEVCLFALRGYSLPPHRTHAVTSYSTTRRAQAQTSSDAFRQGSLYKEDIDDLLHANLAFLTAVFLRYAPKTVKKGITRKPIEMDQEEWFVFLGDLQFIDDEVRLLSHKPQTHHHCFYWCSSLPKERRPSVSFSQSFWRLTNSTSLAKRVFHSAIFWRPFVELRSANQCLRTKSFSKQPQQVRQSRVLAHAH